MGNLKDKVVLITGASVGIGRGIAMHLASCGAHLSLTGRDQDNLEITMTKCQEQGLTTDKIMVKKGDLTDTNFREDLLQKTIAKYGKLDVLVNNAGMSFTKSLDETDEKDFDDLININVKSHFFLIKAAAPALKETKGTIINISSGFSQRPVSGFTLYCMSKSALDMLTQCLSLELAASGVRVNSINPGAIRSMMIRRGDSVYKDEDTYEQFLHDLSKRHPIGRVGEPVDIAKAVSYLASDDASFVTGHILNIDGGWHCTSTLTDIGSGF